MKSQIIVTMLMFFSLLTFSQGDEDQYRNQLSTINKEITQDPGDISLYLAKADIYNNMNDFASANRNYNKVLQMYKDHPDPQFSKTYAQACYRLADDYHFRNSADDQALRYVESGLEVAPDYKSLVILEAMILGDMGQRAEAQDKFTALAQEYPEDVSLLKHYAHFLENFDPMGAAEQYEKIVALEPVNADALITLGAIYNNQASRLIESGSPAEAYSLAKQATSYMEKAYQLNPDDEELANIVEQMHAELGEQPAEESSEEKEKPEPKNVPF